jgi:murein DD-endopeptidase MepM/ murein hydrolase activator NlpD
MSRFFKHVVSLNVLFLHVIVLCSVAAATCPSSLDYGRQNNPIDFATYGYANPMDGFVGAYLAQPFMSPYYGTSNTHLGMDLMTPAGTPVYSICVGKVIESRDMTFEKTVWGSSDNYDSYFNSRVIIQCDAGFLAICGHVDGAKVSLGQRVAQ